MRTCPSCGGVLGRDCFNPVECASISAAEQSHYQGMAENNNSELKKLQYKYDRLVQILMDKGIDLSELDTPPEPEQVVNFYVDDQELPF